MCPLPEEQNTRGRKIHPPEESPTGFGILLTKKIPKVRTKSLIWFQYLLVPEKKFLFSQVCPFPIFTRCGEVMVSLELCPDPIYLTDEQLKDISTFLNYTFTKVLRLNKYFMIFDPTNAPCTYFIVPTVNGRYLYCTIFSGRMLEYNCNVMVRRKWNKLETIVIKCSH